ncbi:MAG: chitobiase/beta-hexosaminidase C-terminal domain-containing protein, partial [Syntrophomonas sp.]
FSTNADAAIFPDKMLEYMDTVEIDGQKGIPLNEVLYETEVKTVKSKTFDIIGTQGEKITVAGTDMNRGILVVQRDGSTGVFWDKSTGYKNINNLLRIRLVPTGQLAEAKVKEGKSTDVRQSGGSNFAIPDEDTKLTITGDGITNTIYLSMKDLKGMQGGYTEQCFSTVNNYPTRNFAVGKGVSISYLLEKAGIKSGARSIQIEASDGYKALLTRDQLLGKRYRYPGFLSGSTANPVEVKSMLAWAFGEGKSMSKATEGELRLVIGQQGLHDVNTAVSVQMVSKITVSTKDTGSWNKAAAIVANGQITLNHDALDQVKLYYTLDGTEPNQFSQVYNPSTTYFQPDLIKPIPVNGSGFLKVKAIGYGKRDSEVLTYAY